MDIKEKINGVTKGSIAFEPEHPIPAQIVRKKKAGPIQLYQV